MMSSIGLPKVGLPTVSLIAALVLTGCTRRVQAWPPPLPIGSAVTIRFAAPHILVVDERNRSDSVLAGDELQGTVLNLRNDTLLVSVTKQRSAPVDNARLVGRGVAIPLDRTTLVTRSEIDSWKFAYVFLASVVLIFAVAVLSGS
jgi:hypothetical protein